MPKQMTHGKEIFSPTCQKMTVRGSPPKTSLIAPQETARELQVEMRAIAPRENVAESPKKTSPIVPHHFVRRGRVETKATAVQKTAKGSPKKTSRTVSLRRVKRLLQATNRIVVRIPKTYKSTLDFGLRRHCRHARQKANTFDGAYVGSGRQLVVASTEESIHLV